MAFQSKRHALGQHFLKSPQVVETIIESFVHELSQSPFAHVLEIGPGKGALTRPLIQQLKNLSHLQTFTLAEKDEKFVQTWEESQKNEKLPFEWNLLEGDFLKQPPSLWQKKEGLAVISNLPYSSGTAILIELAKLDSSVGMMVLMFQAEVAMRLRAEPRTPHRGSLSVWFQNLWDVKTVCGVPPDAFKPPPRVHSEVIFCKRRSSPRIQIEHEDEPRWESFLRGCFAHRRKMLRSIAYLRNALGEAGIDGTKRAEALDFAEWEALYRAFQLEKKSHIV